MAMVPSGATIMVPMTYAPRITMFWTHSGPLMPMAFVSVCLSGFQSP